MNSRQIAAALCLAAAAAACAPASDEPEGEASDDETDRDPNRLVNETSPYLLQHAYNPVDWYPWGEEAFEKARREDKPLFLSVGYSTCYWCHVMEKESFEDEEVAERLNKHFVPIKVDREQRPDIDEQYMIATQLLTGRGGWPNSVWLTPDGRPWMAGTYFPKDRFMAVLQQLAIAWETRRDEVERNADRLAEAIAQIGAGEAASAEAAASLSPALVEDATKGFLERFDETNAGFGGPPKFPPHGILDFLMERYRTTGDEATLKPALRTLDAMWLGGIRDHVGGGFHRYSTDHKWLLPHFEKMLYDNAQLLRAYAEAYALTGEARYREAVEDVYRWIEREMTDPEGGFYSALDSGEVGAEGAYYVWTVEQLEAALGEDDAALFADVYQFEERGNFEEESTGERTGANIPHLPAPVEEIARQRGADPETFKARLNALRERLLEARQKRPPPHKDNKVLASWNGLMIEALAYAGRTLEEPRYVASARRAAAFVLDSMRTEDGSLLRSFRDGQAVQPAFLDDHAYLAKALLELDRADDEGERRWLREAQALADRLLASFEDKQNGGFYLVPEERDPLLVRSKALQGGGNLPSPNGVAIQTLLQLSERLEEEKYAEAAGRAVEGLAALAGASPFSQEHVLLAASQWLQRQGANQPAAVAEASRPAESAADAPQTSRRFQAASLEARADRPSARPGETVEVAVEIAIDDGWHLYGENPDIDFLQAATVSPAPGPGVEPAGVEAPEPKRQRDPFLEKTVNTYEGRIRFTAAFRVAADAAPGRGSLGLEVALQACDDKRCLQPEKATLSLPIQILPGDAQPGEASGEI